MASKNKAILIGRNKDGRQNLNDLRKALRSRKDVMLVKQGGDFILHQWSDVNSIWMTSPIHPSHDEREAIQIALFGEFETEDCIESYRK